MEHDKASGLPNFTPPPETETTPDKPMTIHPPPKPKPTCNNITPTDLKEASKCQHQANAFRKRRTNQKQCQYIITSIPAYTVEKILRISSHTSHLLLTYIPNSSVWSAQTQTPLINTECHRQSGSMPPQWHDPQYQHGKTGRRNIAQRWHH